MCDINCQTNGILLKVEDTTPTKNKNKPVVLKCRTKSRLKSNPLTEVISTRAKNKSKTTISNISPKNKNKIKIKSVDRIGSDCTNTKNTHVIATKYEKLEMKNIKQNWNDMRCIRR